MKSINVNEEEYELHDWSRVDELNQQMHEIDKQDQGAKQQVTECRNLSIEVLKEEHQGSSEVFVEENEPDPVFVGTKTPELKVNSSQMLDLDLEVQVFAWPEKAIALKKSVSDCALPTFPDGEAETDASPQKPIQD